MIADLDRHRPVQSGQPVGRGVEFRGARPHRQVAGHHDRVGLLVGDAAFEPGERVAIFRAEMHVADMEQADHHRPTPAIAMVSERYSAASSVSAPPKSTDTSRLTPRSTIVTPNSRCIRLIVTALWVTIR